jgi:hypothetical protein
MYLGILGAEWRQPSGIATVTGSKCAPTFQSREQGGSINVAIPKGLIFGWGKDYTVEHFRKTFGEHVVDGNALVLAGDASALAPG